MNQVLIISKTRMWEGACIGGITLPDLKSVRLLNPGGAYHASNTKFEVGQIWEMDLSKPTNAIEPPHVENVEIKSKRFLSNCDDLIAIITEKALENIVWEGSPKALFDGTLKWSMHGSGAVYKDNIPKMSTGFWIPDKDLTYEPKEYKGNIKPYYRYSQRFRALNRNFDLKYVGFQEPIDVIPSGSIVRVSLAKWWHPKDRPDIPDSCTLQLSGWY